LSWHVRRRAILEQVTRVAPDIFCSQEFPKSDIPQHAASSRGVRLGDQLVACGLDKAEYTARCGKDDGLFTCWRSDRFVMASMSTIALGGGQTMDVGQAASSTSAPIKCPTSRAPSAGARSELLARYPHKSIGASTGTSSDKSDSSSRSASAGTGSCSPYHLGLLQGKPQRC